MKRPLATPSLLLGLLCCVGWGGGQIAQAQSITPANDGTGTIVIQQGSDRFEIQGGFLSGDGQNLFHSFEQFGLDAGQIANFLTQPQLQNVLGRVVGGDPSFINGLLQVSGSGANLYLMNPAGIVFGPGASLNVGGDFFATTADGIGFGDRWFNATGSHDYATLVGNPNTFAFEAIDPGSIINAGELTTSGNISLLAGEVVNAGELAANTVTAYAMPESGMVRIAQPDHLLSLEVLPPRDAQGNVGAIAPLDLPTLLTGSPASLSAEAIGAIDPGTTWAAGTITADQINLLGEQVAVFDTLTTPTGGSVRIGGDYLGEGTIPNAQRTYVDPAAVINAEQGRVIVWSDELTRFSGTVNAAGGFVETSSKDHLEVIGSRVIAADWLLDPRNVTITNITNGGVLNPVTDVFTPTADNATIDAAEIVNALNLGSTVTITTGSTGGQAGNITVDAEIKPNGIGGGGFANLILNAANDITVNAEIENIDPTLEHFLNVELFAGGNIDINARIITGGGKIELRSGGNIDTTGVTLSSADLRLNATNAVGGNVILNATGAIATGAIDASATGTGAGDATAGNVTLTATGTTPSLTSQRVADGSLITREAGSAITTTVIDASATSNADTTGGNVTLTAVGSVNTAAINTSATAIGVGAATDGITTITQTPATTVFVPDEIIEARSLDCVGEGCGNFPEDAPEYRALRYGDYPMPTAYCQGDTQQAVTVAEDYYSQELGSYLNLGRLPALLSGVQTQQVLQTVARTIGQDTAIVYMGFCTPSQTTALETRLTGDPNKQTEQLEQLGIQDRDRLVLVVGRPEGEPLRYEVNVSRSELRQVSDRFRRMVANPSRRTAYLKPAQQLYDWLLKPLEADLQAAGIDHLAYVAVPGLRTIPLAALHDGQDFAIARYSLSLLPSLSLTNPNPVNLQDQTVLAMGASTFADQPSLPAVPVELAAITEQLWQGEAYLNEAFTYQRLHQARQATPKGLSHRPAHGIVHLATHALFQPGRPEQSYIQLWDRRLAITDAQSLDWRSPLVELLVLSACDTALGDADAELGFTGLAVTTGAKSAIGSLWIVSDLGTLALMAEFYQQLQGGDRAQSLQQAQLAMSRGQVTIQDAVLGLSPGASGTAPSTIPLPPELLRFAPADLSHPFYWAAFTLVGSPW